MTAETDNESKNTAREAFLEVFLVELRTEYPDVEVEFDEDSFSVRLGGVETAGSTRVYLERTYGRALQYERSEWPGIARQLVASLQDHVGRSGEDDLSALASRILPRVRERSRLLKLQLQLADEENGALDTGALDRFVHFDAAVLPSSHYVELIEDRPNSVRLLTGTMVEGLGWNTNELSEQARTNLVPNEQDAVDGFVQTDPGVYVSNFEDGNDMARLLFPRLFRRLDVRGRPVVFPLSCDVVLVTGEDEPEGIKALAINVLKRLDELSHEGIVEPWVLGDDDTWQVLELDEDHPAYSRVNDLRRTTALGVYATAQTVLEKTRGEGDAAPVGEFRLFQNKETGHVRSCCRLTGPLDGALLPAADLVWMGPSGDAEGSGASESVTLAMNLVLKMLADRVERTDDYPCYYRLTAAPTEEQWAALRALDQKVKNARE